ncbi:hypothetical protein BDZ94DRAFT_1271622 [Collybia nuda]|uniref:Uncharacterized protein n=1 Tax=Collybia nuda TaxID=64659 RepID=A0A9P5XWE9_9AGAR|nr:hypothetical protein BDZ94DRAFT_1271622 [Collybia nuda]
MCQPLVFTQLYNTHHVLIMPCPSPRRISCTHLTLCVHILHCCTNSIVCPEQCGIISYCVE